MKGGAFAKVCRLGGQAASDYRMIREGDRLLIGLSGGLDSMVLLMFLTRLQKRAPFHFELEAATYDPQFPGFDARGTHDFCESLGVKHHLIPLDVPSMLKEKDLLDRPCFLCSRLRRGCLYTLARKLKCNKLALGQHLDDVIISFLISLTRGGGITSMGPNVPSEEGSVRVIRPFVCIDEKTVKEAAKEFEFPVRGECLYRKQLESDGDRAFGRHLLAELEQRIPDVRRNILHSLCDVRPPWLMDLKFLKDLK